MPADSQGRHGRWPGTCTPRREALLPARLGGQSSIPKAAHPDRLRTGGTKHSRSRASADEDVRWGLTRYRPRSPPPRGRSPCESGAGSVRARCSPHPPQLGRGHQHVGHRFSTFHRRVAQHSDGGDAMVPWSSSDIGVSELIWPVFAADCRQALMHVAFLPSGLVKGSAMPEEGTVRGPRARRGVVTRSFQPRNVLAGSWTRRTSWGSHRSTSAR